MEKNIDCLECDGSYVLREGKYGLFFGCSNWPRCNSKMSLNKYMSIFFSENGINVYRWKRKCWKCASNIDIYSYFLMYELRNVHRYFRSMQGVGLGDVPSIDAQLSKVVPSISKNYSYTVHEEYYSNVCPICGALQGKYYVVTDPHDILMDLERESMDKYLYCTLSVSEDLLLKDFKGCESLKL